MLDEQAEVADRFRSLLLRALVLIGGVLAGTALAWLLSSATASAAEPTPVSTLLSTAGDVVDTSVEHTALIGQDARLAAQALPAAAPSVPAIDVPVPHLVAPVILVEQRLDEFAGSRSDEPVAGEVVTRTYVPVHAVSAAESAESVPVASRVERPTEMVAAHPQAGLSAPVSPLRPDGTPKSEVLPFGALPGGACGHDGPTGSGSGMALHDGSSVVPAAAPVLFTSASSRCVPMTARRQPGITPD
ncbi:LigA protein [Kutzneria sp. 744]|nr:LigA protein [Kutzneria sp. 744]